MYHRAKKKLLFRMNIRNEHKIFVRRFVNVSVFCTVLSREIQVKYIRYNILLYVKKSRMNLISREYLWWFPFVIPNTYTNYIHPYFFLFPFPHVPFSLPFSSSPYPSPSSPYRYPSTPSLLPTVTPPSLPPSTPSLLPSPLSLPLHPYILLQD